MFDQLNEQANHVIQDAMSITRAHGGLIVRPAQVLAALTRGTTTAAGALRALGVTEESIRQHIPIEGSPPPRQQRIGVNAAVQRLVDRAAELARASGAEKGGPEHLLVALVREPDPETGRLLRKIGLEVAGVESALQQAQV